jgi:DNA-binding NarL/FixJ family response regulator
VLKDIRVAIIEEDPFARNWIALLLARDWRTRVVAEAGHPAGLPALLVKDGGRVDVILLSLDPSGRGEAISTMLEKVSSVKKPLSILLIASSTDGRILKYLSDPRIKGFILKNEIEHSVSWAVSLAAEGSFIITPGVYSLATRGGYAIPEPCLVLDGRHAFSNFTEHQANVARLAFLFSMERRNLAGEVGINEEWSYGLVSSIYEKLGLKEILHEEVEAKEYFGNNEMVLANFRKIKEKFRDSGKASDMESLAFHVLTMPEVKEVL